MRPDPQRFAGLSEQLSLKDGSCGTVISASLTLYASGLLVFGVPPLALGLSLISPTSPSTGGVCGSAWNHRCTRLRNNSRLVTDSPANSSNCAQPGPAAPD